MKARPLRTRDELLELVAQHAPTKACATAMREDRAIVLGGFNPVEDFPGWVVRITSRRDREWIVAVECDEVAYKFKVLHLTTVPWANWAGRSTGLNPLIDGDSPNQSAFMRMKARMKCSVV